MWFTPFVLIYKILHLSFWLIASGLIPRAVVFFLLRSNAVNVGKSFTLFLYKAGPAFIKLGQMLATRRDIVGATLAKELTALQDKVPPVSFQYIEKALNANLYTNDWHAVFREIEEVPIAAASVAQVHQAILHNGALVAIKVLRPGIHKMLHVDCQLIHCFLWLVDCLFGKKMHLEQIAKQLKKISSDELDLRQEAAATNLIAENMRSDHNIIIPKIYWDYSSEHVLVSQWIDGTPIYNTDVLSLAGHDLQAIARNLAVMFFNQAYRDGVFHADLHAGNILITPDGKIALLDFGIISYLVKKERLFIAEMLYAFMQRDYDKVASLHFIIGYVPKHQDILRFSLACRSIGEPMIGKPSNQVSAGKMLKQLFDVATKFDMHIQPQLLLLQKTMIMVEGVGTMLDADINMWELAEPWIKSWAKDNFGWRAQLHEKLALYNKAITIAPELLINVAELIERYLMKEMR